MKYHIKSDKPQSRGFIYVASLKVSYYELAVYSATTLKDYYPDASITLFTHEKFLDKKCEIFDNVITEIPVHYRSKMWGIARSPYEKTIYIDADSFICHKDIRSMHDHLDDCDVFFCPVTTYTVGNIKVAYIDKAMTEPPSYHGAITGYNKSALTTDFYQTWYDEYIKQVTNLEWPYEENHYSDWKPFDMFTLWRITSNKYGGFDRFKKLKIKTLPLRYIITAQHTEADKKFHRPVIHQVDSTTWRSIPSVWNKIQERLDNEIHSFKEFSIKKIPTEYN